MPNYRRAFVPGGCWFFTVNLLDRRQALLVDHIETLRRAVAATRMNYAFTIDAFVVLPDHLHAIWQLPQDDCDFFTRWRLIKNRFAKALPRQERLTRVRDWPYSSSATCGQDCLGKIGPATAASAEISASGIDGAGIR